MKKSIKFKMFSIFLALCLCAISFNFSLAAKGETEYIPNYKVLMCQPYSSLLDAPFEKLASKNISTLEEFEAFLPLCHDTFYDREKFNFDSEFFKDNNLIVLSTKGSSSIEYRVVSVYDDYFDKTAINITVNKFSTEIMKEDCVDYTILVSVRKAAYKSTGTLKLEVNDEKYTLPMLEGKEIKYDLSLLNLGSNLIVESTDNAAAMLVSSHSELSAVKKDWNIAVLAPYSSDFFETKAIIIFSYFSPTLSENAYPAELIQTDNEVLTLNYNRTLPRQGYAHANKTQYLNLILEIEKKDIPPISPSCPFLLHNVDVIDNDGLKNEGKFPISKTFSRFKKDTLPKIGKTEGMSFEEYIKSFENISAGIVTASCYDNDSNPITDLSKKIFTGATVHFSNDKDNSIMTKTIIVPGDVDCNGIITATDARLALRASAELEKLPPAALKAATPLASNLTAYAARQILKYSAGLESEFICEDFYLY